MTEPAETDVTDPDPDEPDDDLDDLSCPECGETFDRYGRMARAQRSIHRRKEHGITPTRSKSHKSPRPPRPAARPGPRGGRGPSRRDLEDGVREAYETVGILAAVRGDEQMARLVLGNKRYSELSEAEPSAEGIAGAAAKAWAKLAQHSPGVERTLSAGLSTSDWAEVVGAHLPLIFLAAQRKPERVTGLFDKLKGRASNAAVRRSARRMGGRAPTAARPDPDAGTPAPGGAAPGGYSYYSEAAR